MNSFRPKYKQAAVYVVLLIAVIILMNMTRRCGTSPLAAVQNGNSQGDTIDVAIIYGPYSYYLYDDTLGGINYDMLRLFEKQINRKVKLWPVVSLHDALARLENHTYDMLASIPSAYTVKQRFLTTKSVFLDRLVLIQLADASGETVVNSALDLADCVVNILEDSPADVRLENLSNEIGDTIYIHKDKNLSEEYLCMMVATGKIQFAVVNERSAARMKKQYPLLSYDNPVSFTQFQVWVLPKEDSLLLDCTDKWLKEYQATESYRELINRYATE